MHSNVLMSKIVGNVKNLTYNCITKPINARPTNQD